VTCGEVVVVTTPEPTALTDAYALIKVIRSRDPGVRVWLLVNMAQTSEEAERTLRRVDEVSRRHLDFRVKSAGYVLSDPAVVRSVRSQRPFALAEPDSPASGSIRRVCHSLGFDRNCRHSAPRGLFRRLATLFTGAGVDLPTGQLAAGKDGTR